MLNDTQLALLGNHAAVERVTESGKLLPCHCGGEMEIMVPKGIAAYPADIYYRPRCKECFAIGAAGRTAKQAIKFWNTRAPILTPEQIKRLEDENRETDL